MIAQPASHLLEWFIDLCGIRTHGIISGMGGGSVIYNPIPPTELEAWGRISGNRPTIWESSVLLKMDTAFVAGKSKKESNSRENQYQGIGDYCHGEEVDKCRAMFGEGLEQICRTCPN
jgi:hypothetical protein